MPYHSGRDGRMLCQAPVAGGTMDWEDLNSKLWGKLCCGKKVLLPTASPRPSISQIVLGAFLFFAFVTLVTFLSVSASLNRAALSKHKSVRPNSMRSMSSPIKHASPPAGSPVLLSPTPPPAPPATYEPRIAQTRENRPTIRNQMLTRPRQERSLASRPGGAQIGPSVYLQQRQENSGR